MKKLFLSIMVTLILVAVSFAASLYAFSQADVQKLTTTKQCPDCDLSEANLGGADLYGVYLNGANLSGANLSGANLTGALLNGATWTDGSKCQNGALGQCNK